MNQQNARRLKQKGTASLAAWDFKSRDTPKEVPEPQKESMSAFANVPRRTEIMGQPHMLSYINPQEEAVLQQMRGGLPPVAGPDGVPSYFSFFSDLGSALSGIGSAISDTVKEVVSGGSAVTNTYNSGDNNNVTYAPTNTSIDFSLPGSDDPVATIDYGNDGGITNVTYHDDKDDKPATTTTDYDASSEVTPFTTDPVVQSVVYDSNTGTYSYGGVSGLTDDQLTAALSGGVGVDTGVPGIDTSYADGNAGYFVDGLEFQGPDYNFSSVDTSAKDADLGVGAINTGLTYSGSDPVVSGSGDDTSQLSDAEKEEIVMSQPVINDDGTLNTNIITPVVSPETTYTSPSLDPKKLLDAAEEGLLNVTTLGEDSVAVPYPSGVSLDRSGGTTSIVDAATGTLLGDFPYTDNPDVDMVAAIKIAFDRGIDPNSEAFQDEIDKILFDEGYSYTQNQLSNNNYYELGEGVNIVLGEDISGAVTNKEGKLGLDFGQITESPFENAITVDVSQIQPDETEEVETEVEIDPETGEVDLSAFGGAGDEVNTGALGGYDTVGTGTVDDTLSAFEPTFVEPSEPPEQIDNTMEDPEFPDQDVYVSSDVTEDVSSGEGEEITDEKLRNTVAYDMLVSDNGFSDAEALELLQMPSFQVFDADDNLIYDVADPFANMVEDGDGTGVIGGYDTVGTGTVDDPANDIIFNEDGTVSTGDGDTYDTAQEALDATINGTGTGTGGTGDGEGSGEGLGDGEGTGEGDGLGDGTGDGTGDGEDGDGDGAGTGDGEGEGDGTGDGTGDGDGEVNQVADSYRVDQEFAVRDIVDEFNRRRKSGLGYGLPEYMRRYMSGQVIDELVRRVELPDGSVFYVTPDGRYLDPKEFIGTRVLGDPQSIKTGEERYQSGYTTTNLRTGEQTRYDTDGNPV